MIDYITFGNPSAPKPLAILIPNRNLKESDLLRHYVDPLVAKGMNRDDIIVFNLDMGKKKTMPVTAAREYLKKLEPILNSVGVTTLMCCDGSYFKALTKVTKVAPHLTYRMDTILKGINAFYCPNFAGLFFNPDLGDQIALALRAVNGHFKGSAPVFSDALPLHAEYPDDKFSVQEALLNLEKYSALTVDVETWSLQVNEAGLGTIAFGTDDTGGTAFRVDFAIRASKYGNSILSQSYMYTVRGLLKNFFLRYKGKLIFHNAPYDCKVLIWELFMKTPEDINGMLQGLHCLFRNIEDTQTLAYLALNSCSNISLSLKDLAFEHTGTYAIDVTNIDKHEVATICKYNLIDCCATWFVYNKFRKVVKTEQESVYQDVFRPALKVITQMELCGLPMNLGQILNAEGQLDKIVSEAREVIQKNPLVVEFTRFLRHLEMNKANAKLKVKIHPIEHFQTVEFNPASGTQLQLLLYQELKLPIINKTEGGEGSTDATTLKALVEHEIRSKNTRQGVLDLIEQLQILAEASTILTTFIPAFKDKSADKDGWRYLLGSFKLGGTKSGRLSSSKPNMQNIPSTGTKYAKLVKACFQAPPMTANDTYGWLFVGADYFSLEDKISALLTKDPNKLKIYLDGYDGHCLRAYSYFSNQMVDITQELKNLMEGPQRVAVINSIAIRYPDLRQDSKSPTFALTYMGTWRTLMKKFGFKKAEAMQIDKNFHDLYSVSDEWVAEEIRKANICGYVNLAFDLKLRTPMLPKVILSSYDSMPYAAYSEIKTAANALGQSYGLLNTYSATMFMNKVWVHKRFSTWIQPCAQIHDSQYYMIRNHLGCLKWVNDTLIECMEWADLDPIRHPDVGLGAELEIYYPDWANPIKVPNKASLKELRSCLDKRLENV